LRYYAIVHTDDAGAKHLLRWKMQDGINGNSNSKLELPLRG